LRTSAVVYVPRRAAGDVTTGRSAMGRIVYMGGDDEQWLLSPLKPGMKEGDPRVRYRHLSARGDAQIPRATLAEYDPRHVEPRHSHAESELLYVTSGEAAIDGTTLRPGMLVFVEGGSEYGPIVGGPEGFGLLRIEV
jgi:cupin domain